MGCEVGSAAQNHGGSGAAGGGLAEAPASGTIHARSVVVDPDVMDREANAEDESLLREFAGRYFPGAMGPTLSMQTCLFTNTLDERFILDFLGRVIIGSPCSGHGFKFSSVVGEILADLAGKCETTHDIALHGFERLYTANRQWSVESSS
jgi:sarcosine oxidase